ncbi:MAG TPA: 2-succinyl-5-enolpyruvyl-6-hydroxy-3-cyclohexene-1-carboxylic-acid synthase [Solirubrobacterales bacterium]|nr:2-succinyl-5-enolpyruvyl-6-hydroxy-3-cyclohexene-1-carboxylic-acid synthase [Solirubrobacterales bacterium]
MDPTNANTALASAFAEELARCGVRQAVVSPGSRSTPLAVALWRQPEIEVTIALDERSGGFFALGAAQASGVPVALVCTSGTAAANYHPAVSEADLSGVPLIVLTADRPPELRDIGAGQTIDQIKLFGSAVRWFSEVGNHDADDDGLLHFRYSACRAFALASGDPRPGPVHLNFPLREPLAPSPDPAGVSAVSPLALEGRDGAPLTSVVTSPAGITPDALDRIAGLIDSAERILILAGRQTSTGLRLPLGRIAARCAAPILAEPTSQLRSGPHDLSNVIGQYDAIARSTPPKLAPDLVLRFGEMPTSKALRTWLGSLDELTQVVIDPINAWNEPTGTADLIVRAEPESLLHLLETRIEPHPGRAFSEAWIEADRIEAAAFESADAAERISAIAAHRALARLRADGEIVYTASSMAIRDQEASLPASGTDLLYLANRGANGIDGLLASGIGAAAATGRPTTVITGDLGFQHDLGSLALAGACEAPVRFVVLNNGGGAIFSRLPQKAAMEPAEFDALMTTPSDLSIEAAAALFDLPHFRIDRLDDLPAALAAGTAIIEIPVPA